MTDINKLTNIWVSTNTNVPGSCSFRNEGTSIFSGTLDVSGQMLYEPTSYIRRRNVVNVSLTTADYEMSYLNNGCTYMISTASATQAYVMYLPQSIQIGTAMRYSIVNATGVAVKIACYPGASTHRVYPPNVGTTTIAADNRSYVLQARQSVEIESDTSSGWYFREGTRNNSENVWNKVSQFNANVGVGKVPSYAVDVSGDINFTGNLLLNGSSYVPGGNLLPLDNTWTNNNHFNGNVDVSGVFETKGTYYQSGFKNYTASGYMYQNLISGCVVQSSPPIGYGPISLTLPNLITTTHGCYFYLFGDSQENTNVAAYGTQSIYTTNGPVSAITLAAYECALFVAQVNSYPGIWMMFKASTTNVESMLNGNNMFYGYNYFNSHLPRSTLTPSIGEHLTTKQYVDDSITAQFDYFTNHAIEFNKSVKQKNLNGAYVDLRDYFTYTSVDTVNDSLNLGKNSDLTIFGNYNIEVNSVATFNGDVYFNSPTNASFSGAIPIYNGAASYTSNNQLITRGYADSRYLLNSGASYATQSGTNTFSGSNQYNIHPNYGGVSTPTTTQYTPRSYVDAAVAALPSTAVAFTSTASFDNLPTYTGGSTPTSNNFITRSFADGRYALSATTPTLSSNNTWTNTNAFTGSVSFANFPTYSGASSPTLSTHLTTKNYVDGMISTYGGSSILSSNNTFTGTNSFNNLVTHTAPSTATTELFRVSRNAAGANGWIRMDNNGKQYFSSNGTTDSMTIDCLGSIAAPNWSLSTVGRGSFVALTVTGSAGITATNTMTIDLSGNAPIMSGANIRSATIPTAALAGTFVDTSTTQTIGGAKTFSVAPVMSGANITAATIPDAALSANVLLSSSSLNAANLTGTIADARLSANVVLTSGAQTINGAKIFGDNIEFQSLVTMDASCNIGTGSTIASFLGTLANQYKYINTASQFNAAYITYTTSTTLPTTISGRNINCDPASTPITLTLPTIGTSIGYWYVISADNGDTTLQRSSTNTFRPDNATTSVIPSGYTAVVYETSIGKWGVQLFSRLPSVDTSTSQTIAGVKTFSSPPVMSGASISSATIPTSAISGYGSGFVDTTTNQTIGGTKSFSNRITGSIANVYVSGATGFSGLRLVSAGTIGTDNQLKASSTLTYDQPTDTLNAVNMSASTQLTTPTVNAANVNASTALNAPTINASTTMSTPVLTFAGDSSTAQVQIGRNSGMGAETTMVGYAAGQNLNSSSSACVGIGRNALLSASSGALQETAIGYRAMESYLSGNSNTAIGCYSLLNLKYGYSNTGIGTASGGALVGTASAPSSYNFAMGESCLSNPYLPYSAFCQYTAATSASVSSFTANNLSGSIVPGQYIVAIGAGTANRVDITAWNTSTNVITLSSAVPIDQNVWCILYNPGVIQSGLYSGTTQTNTTFTVQTGLTIGAGYRFSYMNGSGNTRNFTTVVSYNSSTGVIVLSTTITMFAVSGFYTFNMDEAGNKGNNMNNNVACGKYAFANVCTNSSNNTAFGVSALNGQGGGYDNIVYLQGSNNTAFGYGAGQSLVGIGGNNTFVGSGADIINRTTGNISNSTAIGCNAKITVSNQIVIGTSTETTTIPGILSMGTTYAPATSNINTTSPATLTAAQSGQLFIMSAAAGATVNYTLPSAPANGTYYKFANLNTSFLGTITCSGTDTFSQNNQSTTVLRLYNNNFATVEIMYIGGIWNVLGGMFDVLRSTKASTITTPTGLGMGAPSSVIHYPWAVSGSTITATSTLTSPTYGTHLVNCAANATITLPVINSAMVGSRILFRKIGTLASVISVAAGTGGSIYIANNITTVAAGVATQIMSGTQTSGEIQCISSTAWAII